MNVDVTAPGATLALGMLYFNTGNRYCIYPNKERYKTPSYQIKEGDSVNVDVTAPGATLALGMLYFSTGNR